MIVEDSVRLILFILLLGGSSFASSVEASFFSLSPGVLERLKERAGKGEERVIKLLGNPQKLLVTILIINTLTNTLCGVLTAWLAIDWAKRANFPVTWAIIIQMLIVSLLILYVGDLIPKLYGIRYNEKWAVKTAGAVAGLQVLLTPLSGPLASLANLFSRMLEVQRSQPISLSDRELKALVSVGHRHGALEPEEKAMIYSIFELGDTTVKEVMVPRVDMVVAEKSVGYRELVEIIQRCGHSRIPIYEGNIDNIIGIVHGKDLLPYAGNEEEFLVQKVMRKAYFVPEEKKIDELLREFQQQKVHMAIVVDEYGGTAGLITMEDIIEEIVGDIQDEYDREMPDVLRLDENTIIARGRTTIYDINEEAGSEVVEPDEAYDTLGGFIYTRLSRVPNRGESFIHNDYRFTVEELSGKRILKVRMEKLQPPLDENR